MNTLVPGEHPLRELAEEERVSYLIILASMAFADGKVDADELKKLDTLCAEFGLPEAAADEVRASATNPEQTDTDAHLSRLAGSSLALALVVDAVDMACADGVVTADESQEVDTLARKLNVLPGQVATIRRYVMEARGLAETDEVSSEDVAAGVAAAGVPAAVLTVAAAVGAPAAAGIGLAAALGIGGYMSVKWLMGRGRQQKSQ